MGKEGIRQDLRYALRTARKSPGFVIAAAGTLALGIGATTAIFSILSGVLLRPLPFAHPEQLVQVYQFDSRNAPGAVFYSDMEAFRTQGKAFASMVAFGITSRNLLDLPEPERVQITWAERGLFGMLGAAPIIGRTFQQSDSLDVVVLSATLWKRRFGGDPSLVGRKITFDGEPFTVIGVMPDSFQFPYRASRTEAWIPWEIPARSAASRNSRVDSAVARLTPGVSLEAARSEASAICRRLAEQAPGMNSGRGVLLTPLDEVVSGRARPALLTLLGAVGLVLLIACANVANLLLARAARRSHEVAVRAALGATRGRLIQQLLTENILLSLVGGLAGLALAIAGGRALLLVAGAQIPRSWEIGLDWRVFSFLLVVSVATGIAFGLLPALTASRVNPEVALKQAGDRRSVGSGSAGWSGRRLRDGLVVAEVALSFVLLVSAGLLMRAFVRLQETPTGLVADRVLTLRLTAALRNYAVPGSFGRYLDQLAEQVSTVPGVRSAGFIQYLPLQNFGWSAYFSIPGRTRPGEALATELRYVTPGYFETLRIPLRSGRLFTPRDTADVPIVILVNEAFARRYFPDEDPVGRKIDRGEIIGIVGDVRTSRLDRPPAPELYYSFTQNPAATTDAGVSLVLSTEAQPETLARGVTAAIHQVNPHQVVYDVKTMERVIANSVADVHLYLWLIGIFAGLALLLALCGVYAVISCLVAARTQEFGVRVALGARAPQIARLVLGHCAVLLAGGIAIGAAAALAVARLLKSLLSGVDSADPATLVVTSVLLAAVGLAASLAPARRAMSVDPVAALR